MMLLFQSHCFPFPTCGNTDNFCSSLLWPASCSLSKYKCSITLYTYKNQPNPNWVHLRWKDPSWKPFRREHYPIFSRSVRMYCQLALRSLSRCLCHRFPFLHLEAAFFSFFSENCLRSCFCLAFSSSIRFLSASISACLFFSSISSLALCKDGWENGRNMQKTLLP